MLWLGVKFDVYSQDGICERICSSQLTSAFCLLSSNTFCLVTSINYNFLLWSAVLTFMKVLPQTQNLYWFKDGTHYWYTFQMKFRKFPPSNLVGEGRSHSGLFCKGGPAESHPRPHLLVSFRKAHCIGSKIHLSLCRSGHIQKTTLKKKVGVFVQLQFSIKFSPFGIGLTRSIHIPSHRYLAESSFLFWRGS